MNWQGLNRRVDPNELGDSQSPDCSNTRTYQGVLNQLGPRPGKTFTNATAYTNPLLSVFAYTLPNRNRRFLLGDNNGGVSDVAAQLTSFANPSPAVYGGTQYLTLASNLTLSVNYPSTSGSAYVLFSGGASATCTSALLIDAPTTTTLSCTDSALGGGGNVVFTISPCDAAGAALGLPLHFGDLACGGGAAGSFSCSFELSGSGYVSPGAQGTAVYGLLVSATASWGANVTSGTATIGGIGGARFISL